MAEYARKTKVCSWNEWDPLKHVIVGRADGTMIQAPEPAVEREWPEYGVPARDLRAAAQGDGGQGQRAAGQLRRHAREAGHPRRPADADRLQPGGPDTGLEAGHHVRLHAAAGRAAHRGPRDPRGHHVLPQPLVRVPRLPAAARAATSRRTPTSAGRRRPSRADRAHLQEGLLDTVQDLERGGETRAHAAARDWVPDRGGALLRRGRRRALRPGPDRPAVHGDQRGRHPLAPAALPEPPRACGDFQGRRADAHRRHLRAAAAGAGAVQPPAQAADPGDGRSSSRRTTGRSSNAPSRRTTRRRSSPSAASGSR